MGERGGGVRQMPGALAVGTVGTVGAVGALSGHCRGTVGALSEVTVGPVGAFLTVTMCSHCHALSELSELSACRPVGVIGRS